MAEFIKTNLINGYRNGSFTKEQVNMFALNYLLKNLITQEVFDYIMTSINLTDSEE